jgi:ABC-type multidrug transport system ATPase subunit
VLLLLLLCQFDILWPDITVREHLVLYAVIKGATWTEAGSVAEGAAAEVLLLYGLWPVTCVLSSIPCLISFSAVACAVAKL